MTQLLALFTGCCKVSLLYLPPHKACGLPTRAEHTCIYGNLQCNLHCGHYGDIKEEFILNINKIMVIRSVYSTYSCFDTENRHQFSPLELRRYDCEFGYSLLFSHTVFPYNEEVVLSCYYFGLIFMSESKKSFSVMLGTHSTTS